MIAELRRHYDKAKQLQLHGLFAGHRQRQINTMWCYLSRLVYLARGMDAIDGNTAVCGAAKTSRRARLNNTKDGGTQGFFRKLRAMGLDVNTDPKSILKAERELEAAGIVTFTRAGNGRVAIAHINLRAAALFLEAYHPDLEWLQSKVGNIYDWMPAFFNDILVRKFNRLEDDTVIYDTQSYYQDLEVFEAEYPVNVGMFTRFAGHVRRAIERFCCKRRSPNEPDSVFVWWDVDISGGDPCWEPA